MDPTMFDELTKRFAVTFSRRTLMKAAAGLAAVAAAPAGLRQASALSDASTLVQNYYEAVDAYQYADAYAMLGSAWHGRQSLANFTSGYADTAFVQCAITGEQSVSGGTSVGVKLVAWGNDGTITAYTGSYTVGTENGKLLMISGNNTQTALPAGTRRLCRIKDLKFSFGQWTGGAGSRFSNVVARNAGVSSCMLGGSPRVTLTDGGGHSVVSTSEVGSPPTGIKIHHGNHAHAPLRFGNWCEGDITPFTATIEIAGDTGHANLNLDDTIALPPCLGTGQTAAMDVKGWLRYAS